LSGPSRSGPLRVGFGRAVQPTNEKGSNMSLPISIDPEETGDEETAGQRRGGSHAMWGRRRQAKQRTRVRAKRRRASMAAMNGMHMRRNKRLSW
jgi:hypothetical protein